MVCCSRDTSSSFRSVWGEKCFILSMNHTWVLWKIKCRDVLYWLGMSTAIEEWCQNVKPVQSIRNQTPGNLWYQLSYLIDHGPRLLQICLNTKVIITCWQWIISQNGQKWLNWKMRQIQMWSCSYRNSQMSRYGIPKRRWSAVFKQWIWQKLSC